MTVLEKLGKMYGTQKLTQGFLPVYERYFSKLRNKPIIFLEVGIAEGASLRMWYDYFTNGCITGIDASLENYKPIKGVDAYEARGETWETDLGYYSIIIDDASHIASEQLATFNNLWPYVPPGGWYVIEDLFTLYDPVWNPSGTNILDLLQSRQKDILIGGDEIQEVHFHGGNSMGGIVFIRKRFETYRVNDEY